jgi:hypothetical protein
MSDKLRTSRMRSLAFAMGTHVRLGRESPVIVLVLDILLDIARKHGSASVDRVHRESLFEADAIYAGTFYLPLEYAKIFKSHRLLLRSEILMELPFAWPGRTEFFFCRRGWFAGVRRENAPEDAVSDHSVTGVYESVPHIFCKTRFPICRPWTICRHLYQVSRVG